jgi:small-conductance mechanosensitive channel
MKAYMRPVTAAGKVVRLGIKKRSNFCRPDFSGYDLPRHCRSSIVAIAVFSSVFLTMAAGAPPAVPSTNAPSSPAATNSAAAIAPAEIASQAEAAMATLQNLEASLDVDQTSQTVEGQLPALVSLINDKLDDTTNDLARHPTLPRLHRLSSEWAEFRDELNGWKRSLAKRGQELSQQISQLSVLQNVWDATLHSGETSKLPAEVVQRVQTTRDAVQNALRKFEQRQGLVLKLQDRVIEQDGQVSQALSSIERAREEAISQLFVREGRPLWSSKVWSRTPQNAAAENRRFSRQLHELVDYVEREKSRFLLHALLLAALTAALWWAKRAMRKRQAEEPALQHAAAVFSVPFETALVLALLVSSWIYSKAPRLLFAIIGAGALVPTALILRKLISHRLFPLVTALVCFYFVDQLRTVLASHELLTRLLFLVEMLMAALFGLRAVTIVHSFATATGKAGRALQVAVFAIRVAVGLFLLALAANVLGYHRLSRLIGQTLLTSAYLALVLYGAIRIVDGIVLSALNVRPLVRLSLVKRNHAFLYERTWRLLIWLAVALWIFFLLDSLALRAPLFQDLKALSASTIGFGSHKFVVGDILLFGIAIWIAYITSRISRFVLEEEVFPRVHLAPGLHYSISKTVHYAILIFGFFAGVGLLGFDLSKLTILAGAFSVGLGFGLQNIINNFVSGLILLFERPIKVGDVIQIDTTEGVVEQIGIRASIVRTTNGSEIILPNAKLISDPVTNWTFSRRQRLIVIPLSVAPGTDSQKVIDALKSAAEAHPSIVKDPPPQALFIDFTGGVLRFELRVRTNKFEDWSVIRSELAVAINSSLIAQNITVK